MNTLTYKQAYDKIIDAYFKDEIQPFKNEFCFCGNLNDNKIGWRCHENKNRKYYSVMEYNRMEDELFDGMREVMPNMEALREMDILIDPRYEDSIFNGMSKALDFLKRIHQSRGENVDDVPKFRKRNLLPVQSEQVTITQ